MTLPELNEQNCPVGTELTPLTVSLGEDDVRKSLELTGESVADYTVAGEKVVPPVVLARFGSQLMHSNYHYEAGVHAATELDLKKPVRLGETVTVRGRMARYFERNGNKYYTADLVVLNAQQEVVARLQHTAIYQLMPRPQRA